MLGNLRKFFLQKNSKGAEIFHGENFPLGEMFPHEKTLNARNFSEETLNGTNFPELIDGILLIYLIFSLTSMFGGNFQRGNWLGEL